MPDIVFLTKHFFLVDNASSLPERFDNFFCNMYVLKNRIFLQPIDEAVIADFKAYYMRTFPPFMKITVTNLQLGTCRRNPICG